jgi:TolB-like protein
MKKVPESESTGPSAPPVTPPRSAAAPPDAPWLGGIWARIKEHKVMQWTLAYAAAAYTLLHGVQMLSDAQEWPRVIVRVLSFALMLGLPLIVTLAWYHGAKGLRRVSAAELTIITLLGLIAGSVLWALTRTAGHHTIAPVASIAGAPPAATTTATPAAPRTAIAVMPFANLTGDPSKDYLGDGMAEELINTLSKVQGLTVPARTSSFAYKGRNINIRDIARDLQVGTIVEGSVRAAGQRIRITAQLINAQDGLHLWSESYDEQLTDLFKLQDKLARQIALALQPNLGGASWQMRQAPPTQDVEAYLLYSQAVSLIDRISPRNVARALALLQQAVIRDPKFARAYGLLAVAHYIEFSVLNQSSEHLAQAEQLARKALALDSNVTDGHNILSSINADRGQWLAMEAQYRASLDNADATTLFAHALHLRMVGHVRESLEEIQRAYTLAPASAVVAMIAAILHSAAGHDSEALKYAGLARDMGLPEGATVGIYAASARRAGRYAEAADLLTAEISPDPDSVRAAEVVKLVYAALADPSRRSAALAARPRLYPEHGGLKPVNSSTALNACMDSVTDYVLLGAVDVAYSLTDQCLNEEPLEAAVPGSATSFLWTPEMRSFRQDKRFQSLVTRLGLMEYWKQYGQPDDCDLKDGLFSCR